MFKRNKPKIKKKYTVSYYCCRLHSKFTINTNFRANIFKYSGIQYDFDNKK